MTYRVLSLQFLEVSGIAPHEESLVKGHISMFQRVSFAWHKRSSTKSWSDLGFALGLNRHKNFRYFLD